MKHLASRLHHQLTERAVENTELHIFTNRDGQIGVRVGRDRPILLDAEARRLLTLFAERLAQGAARQAAGALHALRWIQASTPRGLSISKLPSDVQNRARDFLAKYTRDLRLEDFTCFECTNKDGTSCKYAFDLYNTNGDCLAVK